MRPLRGLCATAGLGLLGVTAWSHPPFSIRGFFKSTGSKLGFATFGGSINLFSKKPGADRSTSVFSSFGNWSTRLLGVAHETGKMAELGNATLQVSLQDLRSDGYLTNNRMSSDNLTAKFERPVGSSSMLTLFTSVNRIHCAQNDNARRCHSSR